MNTIERFSIAGTVTSADFSAAQRLHAGAVAGCILPGIVGVFAAAMLTLGFALRSWEAWPVFLVGIGFPLMYLAARRYAFGWQYRRQPSLGLPTEGEILPDGVRVRSELGEVLMPWRLFVKATANDKVLLLYQAPNLFTILPRSHFENDEAFARACAAATVWAHPPAQNVGSA